MTTPLWILTPHGVEQVEAVVQYAEDGSTCVAIHELMGWPQDGDWSHESETGKLRCGKKPLSYQDGEIDPGQFVVKHRGGRFTVHDTDPRIVPEWEWRAGADRDFWSLAYPSREIANRAYRTSLGLVPQGFQRRPTLTFTINNETWTLTGDWEVVE